MDKKYVLNLENIIAFIFDNSERNNEQEITEVYVADEEDKKLNLTTKQLREVKSGDTTKSTVRYDLIRALTEVVLNIEDMDEMMFNEVLSVNTLLSHGFLTEIND